MFGVRDVRGLDKPRIDLTHINSTATLPVVAAGTFRAPTPGVGPETWFSYNRLHVLLELRGNFVSSPRNTGILTSTYRYAELEVWPTHSVCEVQGFPRSISVMVEVVDMEVLTRLWLESSWTIWALAHPKSILGNAKC
jgi:hypothetical protein